MEKIFNKKLITAVDIGSYSIKVVQIQITGSKNELKINFMKKYFTPEISFEQEKIKVSKNIKTILNKSLKKDINKMGKLVTTFSSTNLLLRNINLPLMSDDDLKKAIKLNINEYFPYSENELAVEFMKTGEYKNENEVMVIAVKKCILNSYINLFRELNLKPEVINIQPMALLSLFEINNQNLNPIMILDIGFKNSHIVIGTSKKIFLSRTFQIGGKDFTREISLNYNFQYEEAERYKIKKMNYEKDNYFNSLIKIIVNEIERSLEFLNTKYENFLLVENLYLTGGGAKLSGLKEILEKNINLNMNIDFLELTNIFTQRDFQKIYCNYEYSVVLGLAISEVITDES